MLENQNLTKWKVKDFMSNIQIVMDALLVDNHTLKVLDTPLKNEFLLDDSWYIEMDRDGAFAATIYPASKDRVCPISKLVVFSRNVDTEKNLYRNVYEKVMDALLSFKRYN